MHLCMNLCACVSVFLLKRSFEEKCSSVKYIIQGRNEETSTGSSAVYAMTDILHDCIYLCLNFKIKGLIYYL